MFKSVNQWSFPTGMPIAEMMRQAKALGFDAFEPALSETGELSLESTDAEVLAVRETAQQLGLRLSSLASGLTWGCSPTSNDSAVREKAQRNAERQLECAKLLGVGAILLVPGTVGTGFWGGEDDYVFYEDAWKRAVESLKALAPLAQKNGVVIGVENVWNNLIVSPRDMLSLLDEVGSPWVQAYLDIGNIVKFGFPEMWVRMLRGRIIRVHIKDFKRSMGTLDGFCDLLSGDVNFPAVMRELKAAGYDADITAEMNNALCCHEENRVARASAAMDVILGRDSGCRR